MRRRPPFRSVLRSLIALVAVAAFVVLLVNAIAFRSARSVLPMGTQIGDIELGGLNADDAISLTLKNLQSPAQLHYQENTIELTPGQIGFVVNAATLKTQFDALIQEQSRWANLAAFILRQNNTPPHFAVPFDYDDQKLQDALLTIAQQYDRPAQQALPDLNAKQLTATQPGRVLNLEEARKLVLDALSSSKNRDVVLPIDQLPQEEISLRTLNEPIANRLKAFNSIDGNISAVFIKDLKTGEELRLNDQLPFSAQGWLRLGLIVEAYRLTQDTPPQSVVQQLDAIALRGDNASANTLLKTLGRGDEQIGIDQFNDTLRKMGLRSTFLAQPFGQPGVATTFVTPANALPDALRTQPDARAQSTLSEVGALLETVEQCRNGVGGLPLAFPGAFTINKCAQIMDLLAHNKINALVEAGSPSASVVHRQSWDDNNHGDAAVVRTPGRTYIVVVMLHSPQPLQWSDTSVIIADIARLTYIVFNNQVPAATPGISSAPAQ